MTNWKLGKDYYQDRPGADLESILAEALEAKSGQVYLEGGSGRRFSLEFNEKYGVCEFIDESKDHYLYARSSLNVRHQIPGEEQANQCCSCCGVEMFTYPSKCHMPRDLALAVTRAVTESPSLCTEVWMGTETTRVEWKDLGDISYNQPGKDADPPHSDG